MSLIAMTTQMIAFLPRGEYNSKRCRMLLNPMTALTCGICLFGSAYFGLLSRWPWMTMLSDACPTSMYCVECIRKEGGRFSMDVTVPEPEMQMELSRSGLSTNATSCIYCLAKYESE